MAVSSLPSRYGIGCFDNAAYEFVDALHRAGQSLWQMLPIGPTSYGDSPYQAFSTFAGNPYFVSLDDMIQRGWLTQEECQTVDFGQDPRWVDYGALYAHRFRLLRLAFTRNTVTDTEDFKNFVHEQDEWLPDYALFMALKDKHGGKSWQQWEKPLRTREPDALEAAKKSCHEDILFYEFVQYMFRIELTALMDYAHKRGIRIIGDIPIYVAMDSADVWAHPDLFRLDATLHPTHVSGCPPDAFAEDGQLWGNPLYLWAEHKRTGFSWWIQRIRNCYQTCDILRIDHFRGFDEYYAIPASHNTAAHGQWEKGPGLALFTAIRSALGTTEIIAEDLGYVTDSVRHLVTATGFAGMKLLEFGFDSRDTGAERDYLPHNYPVNSAAYTGTHDNAPLNGWIKEIRDHERQAVRRYLCIGDEVSDDNLAWPMVCAVLRSVASIAVIPLQDYLGYGSEARMNRPSTFGSNWQWRLLPGEFSRELEEKILATAVLYERGNFA